MLVNKTFHKLKDRLVFAKLIIGFIALDEEKISVAKRYVEKKFGKIDICSECMPFENTTYYEKEFGDHLVKKICSFEKLVSLEKAYEIKKFTCQIEQKLFLGGRRSVNIDPGYVDLAKMVLFMTKDYGHRIYLGENIFSEITLSFNSKGKSFMPNPWTYNDYKSKEYILFFNKVRSVFAKQIV
jgi:hypothetical protein